MVKDGHNLRHSKIKSCKNPAKARNRMVIRGISHTYVFFQGSALYSRLIKAAASKPPTPAKIRQASRSLEGNLLRGLDFRALASFTQYRGKPSRAEGTRSEQQTLKNLPFHPVKKCWKGVKRTLPGTLLRVTQRLFLCLFTSKK